MSTWKRYAVVLSLLLAVCPLGADAAPQRLRSAVTPPPPPPPSSNWNTDHPAPRYPGSAIYAGEQGAVMLLVLIQPDGLPVDITVAATSGFRQLDKAAIMAVRQWQFQANGGPHPGADWYAKLPINFRLSEDYLRDQPGYWGNAYSKPHYVISSEAIPYPGVDAAYQAMIDRYGPKGNSNLVSYPVLDKAGVPVEAWVFLDPGSINAVALHFVRGGSLPAPLVAMSALCADGAESCAQRMRTFLMGPPFARGG